LKPPKSLYQPLFDEAAAPELLPWVRDYCRRQELFQPGERVLVAVSGGPDSVALLQLLYRLREEWRLTLAVAHFDHGLRGRESREDAGFVSRLAASLDLPCHLGRGEVRGLAQAQKISLQMAARQRRHDFLRQTCQTHACTRLALGHTADDQVEWFLLRLLRGAGPEGLKGMWPATPAGLVRPLLGVGKAVLLAWLKSEALPYREDASNLSRRYLRNRVRLDLLPLLRREYNPQVSAAIWRLTALLQDDERLLAAQGAAALSQVATQLTPDLMVLRLSAWLALSPGLQNRVLRLALGRMLQDQEITMAHLHNLVALAQGSRSGGMMRLQDCCLARAGPELHLVRGLPPPPDPALASQLEIGTQGVTPGGWGWQTRIRPCLPEEAPPARLDTAWLDLRHLPGPLAIRYPRPGDRFWPQGGPGEKKLQDFLVDCKIPRWLRPYLPLVESGSRLVWVAGLRITEPVKLTPASQQVLELSLTPAHPSTRRVWDFLLALLSD
jgi:tRNA(Ile)-lysidine synthase